MGRYQQAGAAGLVALAAVYVGMGLGGMWGSPPAWAQPAFLNSDGSNTPGVVLNCAQTPPAVDANAPSGRGASACGTPARPLAVQNLSAPRALLSLDNTTTTTGTAVTVLAAGKATYGGFIYPSASNVGLACFDQVDAAATATQGNTICMGPGQPYQVIGSPNAVTMNASTGSVTVAGYGYGQLQASP